MVLSRNGAVGLLMWVLVGVWAVHVTVIQAYETDWYHAEYCINRTVSSLLASINASDGVVDHLESNLSQPLHLELLPCLNISFSTTAINPTNNTPSVEQPPPDATQNIRHSAGNSDATVVAVIATVACLGGVIAMLAACYIFRRTDLRRTLLRTSRAPGISKDTTFVVTDIQDSTVLWNSLSADVMDKALKEHHDIIRGLLPRFYGYESATEGDAFLLAFHHPEDAILYSAQVQVKLTQGRWPDELLQQEACRPVRLTDVRQRQTSGDAGLQSVSQEPASQTTTFWEAAQKSWDEVSPASHLSAVLAFCGLRVRMGVHSGLTQDKGDKAIANAADNRTHYAGPAIEAARAVCDSAQGGMIVMSASTYELLGMEKLWSKIQVVNAGRHVLSQPCGDDEDGATTLYQVYDSSLACRMGQLGPIRSKAAHDLGAPDASMGCVTVVFMYLVGIPTLLDWNEELTRQALWLFHDTATSTMKRWDGYRVEAVDNLLLAVFRTPAHAIIWCLECQQLMLQVSWPHGLLMHELCEEMTCAAPGPKGTSMEQVVARGLRYRVGIDVGQALATLNRVSGRLSYRGRVMNRAARIATAAGSGQVLCSAELWQHAMMDDAVEVNKVGATNMGLFRLKGFSEQLELYQCRYRQDADMVCYKVRTAGEYGSDTDILATFVLSEWGDAATRSGTSITSVTCHDGKADELPNGNVYQCALYQSAEATARLAAGKAALQKSVLLPHLELTNTKRSQGVSSPDGQRPPLSTNLLRSQGSPRAGAVHPSNSNHPTHSPGGSPGTQARRSLEAARASPRSRRVSQEHSVARLGATPAHGRPSLHGRSISNKGTGKKSSATAMPAYEPSADQEDWMSVFAANSRPKNRRTSLSMWPTAPTSAACGLQDLPRAAAEPMDAEAIHKSLRPTASFTAMHQLHRPVMWRNMLSSMRQASITEELKNDAGGRTNMSRESLRTDPSVSDDTAGLLHTGDIVLSDAEEAEASPARKLNGNAQQANVATAPDMRC